MEPYIKSKICQENFEKTPNEVLKLLLLRVVKENRELKIEMNGDKEFLNQKHSQCGSCRIWEKGHVINKCNCCREKICDKCCQTVIFKAIKKECAKCGGYSCTGFGECENCCCNRSVCKDCSVKYYSQCNICKGWDKQKNIKICDCCQDLLCVKCLKLCDDCGKHGNGKHYKLVGSDKLVCKDCLKKERC